MVNKFSTKQAKLKSLKCELNYLNKSDGSAILSQGETVTLASVNGPVDIKMQSQSKDKAILEVLYSSKGGKPSVRDRYKENVIKQTCEAAVLSCMYPRTGIIVSVQELEDFGNLLACCVNSICLALLNSGLAMRHVFACIACAIDENGEILLDPTKEQLTEAKAVLNFVFDSREKSLITGFTEGTFSEGSYKEALEVCRAASERVFTFYRDIVTKYSSSLNT